jgi:hypothetical protein
MEVDQVASAQALMFLGATDRGDSGAGPKCRKCATCRQVEVESHACHDGAFNHHCGQDHVTIVWLRIAKAVRWESLNQLPLSTCHIEDCLSDFREIASVPDGVSAENCVIDQATMAF